ncbi:DUF3817 domain-containing protein [Salegentibacter sp. HM20]
MEITRQKQVFKWISILEGWSFLILLFLAMPLKYLFDSPEMVRQVGMAHGVLFIAYIMGAIFIQQKMGWSTRELFIVMACSLVPFGPFYMEKRYL